MHAGQELALQGGIEINEDVAAEQQVHMRDGRVLDEIAASEDDQSADFTINAHRSLAIEILFPPFRAQAADSVGSIFSPARQGQSFLINIGGIDFYVKFRKPRAK